MVKALLAVVALVAGALAGGAGPSGTPTKRRPTTLCFTLTTTESQLAGRPVELRFELENLSSREVFVLAWYTPLEGVKGSIFAVTRDGVEVPYQGRMVKRGDPARADYLRLGAGESVAAVVDLALAYDLTPAGTYRVTFNGRLADVTRDGRALPRPRERHHGMDIPGNGVTFRVRAEETAPAEPNLKER